jgi:hypothetical protein
MRRTPYNNKDSEKAWCFPVKPYSSHDEANDLHAVKLKDTPQTHHAGKPSTIEEEHNDDQNPIKEEQKDDPNLPQIFFGRLIAIAWKFYLALAVIFFTLVLIGIAFQVVGNEAHTHKRQ